jgi:hypothetical protein
MRQLYVSDERYYHHPVKPLSFETWVEMYEKKKPGPVGLWRVCTQDAYTGEITQEQWLENLVTDVGGLALWQRLTGVASSVPSAFNQLVVTTNAGVTTLTTALTNGQSGITSLAVAALPGAIASGVSLVIGAGSGQTQTVTTNGSASAGATSITVNSFTANAAYAISTNVAPQPAAGDNPSSLGGTTATSGTLTTSTNTYSGSGTGNRQMQIAYTFSTTGTPAAAVGNYTEAWLTNTYPVSGTGQTAIHVIFNAPMAVNSGSTGPVTLVEKL